MTPATVLLRQAHPNFVEKDLPTSQVFMPNSGDQGKLSAYDLDQISARESYIHYTEVLRNESHSVWGISCQELIDSSVVGCPDPLDEIPSHAIVDFSGKSEKDCRRIAKKLKILAIQRGCLYMPL